MNKLQNQFKWICSILNVLYLMHKLYGQLHTWLTDFVNVLIKCSYSSHIAAGVWRYDNVTITLKWRRFGVMMRAHHCAICPFDHRALSPWDDYSINDQETYGLQTSRTLANISIVNLISDTISTLHSTVNVTKLSETVSMAVVDGLVPILLKDTYNDQW